MRLSARALNAILRGWRDRLRGARWAPWGGDILRPEVFQGKRVIIVGPAETVVDDLAGTDVDSYDVVVRLNNGLALAAARPELLGRRTDILIHNLREDGPRSAGAIPAEVLHRNDVRMLVYPHWHRRAFRAKRDALARNGGPPLKLIPPVMLRRMRDDLGGRRPTVGACAVMFFLDAPIRELAIHGFTFFETAYAPGYNDAVRTAAEARAWVDARGTHEPVSEKRAIARRLAAPNVPPVTLGQGVRRHLEAERPPVPQVRNRP